MYKTNKLSLFPLASIIILSLLGFTGNSAGAITKPTYNKGLVAKKGTSTKVYKLNATIAVVFYNETKDVDKIKGILIDVSNDSIYILPFKKRSVKKGIAVNDIEVVYKLHKKGRRGQIVILSLLLLSTGIGIATLKPGNYSALLFLGIPVVALYTIIPFYIANYAADLISKRSIKKGWSFTTQE